MRQTQALASVNVRCQSETGTRGGTSVNARLNATGARVVHARWCLRADEVIETKH
jgi:hypothetical protein